MNPPVVIDIERAAEMMHNAYETVAVTVGAISDTDRVPWANLPSIGQDVMRSAVIALLTHLAGSHTQLEGMAAGVRLQEQVDAVRRIVHGGRAETYRREAAAPVPVEQPYADNRYVALLDAIREAVADA